MLPKYFTLACRLFGAESNQDLTDEGRAVYFPLNCLKKLIEGLYQERANTIGNLSSEDLSSRQGKHLFTKHLLFSSS